MSVAYLRLFILARSSHTNQEKLQWQLPLQTSLSPLLTGLLGSAYSTDLNALLKIPKEMTESWISSWSPILIGVYFSMVLLPFKPYDELKEKAVHTVYWYCYTPSQQWFRKGSCSRFCKLWIESIKLTFCKVALKTWKPLTSSQSVGGDRLQGKIDLQQIICLYRSVESL